MKRERERDREKPLCFTTLVLFLHLCRTAVNAQSGVRTPLAGLVTGKSAGVFFGFLFFF